MQAVAATANVARADNRNCDVPSPARVAGEAWDGSRLPALGGSGTDGGKRTGTQQIAGLQQMEAEQSASLGLASLLTPDHIHHHCTVQWQHHFSPLSQGKEQPKTTFPPSATTAKFLSFLFSFPYLLAAISLSSFDRNPACRRFCPGCMTPRPFSKIPS